MTNREILEDFIVFYLCQFDELLSKVIYFFNQENGKILFDDSFEDIRYKEFIRHYIDVKPFINNVYEPTEITSLTDLVSKNEIKNLVYFLNTNFTVGNSDEDEIDKIDDSSAGPWKIYTSEIEIIWDFNEYYLKFHKLNPHFYISQLYQFFHYSQFYAYGEIENKKKLIDQLFLTIDIFPLSEKIEIEEHYNDRFKKNMLDSILYKPFQTYGFVDKNGVFFNDELNFQNWVIASNGIRLKYEFDSLSNELVGVDYLIYKYYRYKFYNEDLREITYDTKNPNDKTKNLNIDFQEIKNNNRNLINFLNKKGFDNYQSDTILNVLSDNKFTELNLRSFPYIRKQVEFFRFCYFVYIFDFFEEIEENNFSRESDFNCLKIHETYHVYNSDWKNQFKKYKKNLQNYDSRHFPFKSTVEKTLETIEKKLAIKRDKLKSF